MVGKLFISGGGGAQDSKLLDEEFVRSLKRNKILYIPIGLQRDIMDYEDCYDWIVNTLSSYSKEKIDIEMWINLNNKKGENLDRFDAVYLGGAKNSYSFMKILKKTELNIKFTEFFLNGGNMYGGSTGGIITGKNISVFGEETPNDYKLNDGLGLLGDYSIFCHYLFGDPKQKEKILNFVSVFKTPVVALPEKSGISVDNGKNGRVLGFEPVAIFRNIDTIEIKGPNEFFKVN